MALAGSGLQLLSVNLPGAEIAVALSVILAGLLLTVPARLSLLSLAGVVGLAGIAHGYVFGEPYVGAGPASIAPYLLGLIGMQLVLALLVRYAGKKVRDSSEAHPVLLQRIVGLGVGSVGLAFLVLAPGI